MRSGPYLGHYHRLVRGQQLGLTLPYGGVVVMQTFAVRESAPSRPVRSEEARIASNVGKIQFECYLRRHLYDSTVVTSKNCWSRDALWAALLTMGGDPQKSGELAEP